METYKRTEWGKPARTRRALHMRERKINEEEDSNEQAYLVEQGLGHSYNEKFAPGNFWYEHCATTEQRAAADENYTTRSRLVIPRNPVAGAVEETYMSFRLENNPTDVLFI